VVGNLIPSKGQEVVLRAISQLSADFPHVRCRIIGDGTDRNRLEALSQNLEIAQRVKFVGIKSRQEVAVAMRACSVFVLPSRSEGLGCVYLEAMSCGKPVIACRDQGIEEIIADGSNGYLVREWKNPTDAVAELATKLTMLLQSSDLRNKTGDAAHKTVLNGLTLTHQAQRLIEVYSEAVR
jgi:teichuronic acid biosynthesis glycosyltransferase TuaC